MGEYSFAVNRLAFRPSRSVEARIDRAVKRVDPKIELVIVSRSGNDGIQAWLAAPPSYGERNEHQVERMARAAAVMVDRLEAIEAI